MTDAIERLAAAGIVLDAPAVPVANYVPCRLVMDRLLFVSGQGTRRDGTFRLLGKIGRELSIDDGCAAARLCGLNILAQVNAFCGLSRVREVVKLTGFVNTTEDVRDLPRILDGASDLMGLAFGEAGRHARTTVGVSSLPFGMAVEVEAIFDLNPS